MSLNQLNFFIGVVLGVALAYLLRSGTPLTENDKAMEWRRPLRKASGQ